MYTCVYMFLLLIYSIHLKSKVGVFIDIDIKIQNTIAKLSTGLVEIKTRFFSKF